MVDPGTAMTQRSSSRQTQRPAWSSDLERLALRALAEEYEQLNYSLFSDQLRPPLLSLSDSAQRLGLWTTEPPTITLSRQLLLEQSWGAVSEVLKHEMAHQFVTEVLQVSEPKAHGPLFARVCQERGIDASASGLAAPRSAADDSVLKKVMHLLSLAQSAEQHEAEAAAAAAQRLMLKHNIQHLEHAKEGDYCYVHLGAPTGRVEESQRSLAAILRRFFFVETLWVGVYRVREGKRGSVLEVCGSRANVELAEYVFDFLNGSATHLWERHKQQHGITKDRDRRRFIAGVMTGFYQKLDDERRRSQQRGLVWTGDALLNDYFKRRYPKTRTVRYTTSRDSGAHAAGRRAGQGLVLHRGMKQGASGHTKLLPSAD